MSRWLFFGSPLFGHTNPTLPVVKELVDRGEHVVYYNSDRFEDAIVATGAEFRSYPSGPFVLEDPISKRMLDFAPVLAEAEDVFLREEAERLRAEGADFVIHDCLAIWGAMVARLLGTPRIVSIPTLLVNESVESLSARIMPRHVRPGRADLKLRDIPMLWSTFLKRVRAHRRYGLSYRRFRDLSRGDFSVVFTSTDIQPFADEFDDTICFVGSPTVERPEPTDFPFEQLNSGKPIIYISMGTLFNDDVEFFRICFDALGELDVQVVLSKGKQRGGATLPAAPKNFLVFDYVPQIAILKRSAVFVTHAGIGSSSEALHLGVPQVLIPQIWDGYLMAHQISEKGAGVLLQSPVSRDALRNAVTKVLNDDSFRQNSYLLGKGLAAAGGARRAADAILDWTATRLPSPHG